jgi:hypothetical protein
MDWITEHWTILIGPAVVAAVISSIVTVIGFFITTRAAKAMHREKLAFDQKLAERKFQFEKELAERRFKYDRDLHDHKRRIELAEEVLADFYKAREIILEARSPGSIRTDEGDTRPKMDDETPEETKQYNVYFLVIERLSKDSDFFARLQARKYRFIAHFGAEAVKPYDDLYQILREIRVAVHMLIGTHKMHKSPELETNHRKWCTTIFGGPDEDDIPKRLDAIVTAIEKTCRPAIQETVK